MNKQAVRQCETNTRQRGGAPKDEAPQPPANQKPEDKKGQKKQQQQMKWSHF